MVFLFCLAHAISFFFSNPAATDLYTLSLHDALPISCRQALPGQGPLAREPLPKLPQHRHRPLGPFGPPPPFVGELDVLDVVGRLRSALDRRLRHWPSALYGMPAPPRP